jgi:hypothetical protein
MVTERLQSALMTDIVISPWLLLPRVFSSAFLMISNAERACGYADNVLRRMIIPLIICLIMIFTF